MLYHPIRFGCKKISSSVDMVEKVISDYVSSHCDREPEDSKSVFLQWHSGSWWLITIPCLVTKGSAVEISSRRTFTGILNFSCVFHLNHHKAIQSFHKTIQIVMMCHQTKFTWKRISSSEDRLESYILNVRSITVTLTLMTANQSVWKTIWFIMMHYHTKFGSKRFKDSEDILTQKLTDILKYCYELDLEHSSPISSQDILLYDNILSNQVW